MCASAEVRSFSHGFCAALGKAGALLAGIYFPYWSTQTRFYAAAVCGLVSPTNCVLSCHDNGVRVVMSATVTMTVVPCGRSDLLLSLSGCHSPSLEVVFVDDLGFP